MALVTRKRVTEIEIFDARPRVVAVVCSPDLDATIGVGELREDVILIDFEYSTELAVGDVAVDELLVEVVTRFEKLDHCL